jgi:predicted ATPase
MMREAAAFEADPNTRSYVLGYSVMLALLCRDRPVLIEGAGALQAHATNHGQRFWLHIGDCARASLFTAEGDFDAALSILTHTFPRYESYGTRGFEPVYRSAFAHASAGAGRAEDFEKHSAAALVSSRDTDNRFLEPEVHIRAGLGLECLGRDDAAIETSFCKALDVAREMKSPMWALRAATCLGRLWQRQGRTRKAHDLVAPIYAGFTEGFDLPDLRDAQALLNAERSPVPPVERGPGAASSRHSAGSRS